MIRKSTEQKEGVCLFYRDFFAALCFIAFGAGLAFHHPYLFFAALMLAAFSRTAARKGWENPPWAERLYERWYGERWTDEEEFEEDEEEDAPQDALEGKTDGK
jgi:hypothetical protein